MARQIPNFLARIDPYNNWSLLSIEYDIVVFMDPIEEKRLREKLTELRQEHRDLDDAIERIQENPPINMIQLQRMKKRKLRLKDMIARIEGLLLPDIIA